MKYTFLSHSIFVHVYYKTIIYLVKKLLRESDLSFSIPEIAEGF